MQLTLDAGVQLWLFMQFGLRTVFLFEKLLKSGDYLGLSKQRSSVAMVRSSSQSSCTFTGPSFRVVLAQQKEVCFIHLREDPLLRRSAATVLALS
jgi:hypothetical protein